GMSTVVKRYLLDKSPDRHVTTMTLDDAAHYSAEDRARITAQYPEHERDTRTRGIPQMGSGRVFLVDEEKLLVDPLDCPSHWVSLGGVDFGWTFASPWAKPSAHEVCALTNCCHAVAYPDANPRKAFACGARRDLEAPAFVGASFFDPKPHDNRRLIPRLTTAAGSGVRSLAEKRAAEDDRSLASYISRLIEADEKKKRD